MQNRLCLSRNLRVLEIYWLDQTYGIFSINSTNLCEKNFKQLWLASKNAGERGNGGGIPPRHFKRGETGDEAPFHSNIVGNFMDYQYRIETNLLQLFAPRENSEGLSIISVIIFEVDVVAKQKQALIGSSVLFFLQVSIVLNSITAPCSTAEHLWFWNCELRPHQMVMKAPIKREQKVQKHRFQSTVLCTKHWVFHEHFYFKLSCSQKSVKRCVICNEYRSILQTYLMFTQPQCVQSWRMSFSHCRPKRNGSWRYESACCLVLRPYRT